MGTLALTLTQTHAGKGKRILGSKMDSESVCGLIKTSCPFCNIAAFWWDLWHHCLQSQLKKKKREGNFFKKDSFPFPELESEPSLFH